MEWLTAYEDSRFDKVSSSHVVGYRKVEKNTLPIPKEEVLHVNELILDELWDRHPLLQLDVMEQKIKRLLETYNVATEQELLEAINLERKEEWQKFEEENEVIEVYIVKLVTGEEVTVKECPESDSF